MTAATHIERIRQALEAWNQQFSGWSVSSNGDELTVVWLRDDASKAEQKPGVAGYLAAANPEALTAILADHARLTEALAAAQKDADRYRWLRNDPPWRLAVRRKEDDVPTISGAKFVYIDGDNLDAAIDAAMKEPTNG